MTLSRNKDENTVKGSAVNNEDKQPEQAEPAQAEIKDDKAAQTAQDELPESITLTRDEFFEVRQHIDKLQKERGELVDTAQRLQADFDNFRRRNASVHIESLDEGARTLIREMLPVLDNFDRALNAEGPVDEAWRDGIKLVHKQLMDVLTKAGLSEICADGKFDPELHQAVMQEEVEGKDEGDVAEVLQKGYKVKDRIIRHSMVKVAK